MPIGSLGKNYVHDFCGKLRDLFSALYSCEARCKDYFYLFIFDFFFLTDKHSYLKLGQKCEKRWNDIWYGD